MNYIDLVNRWVKHHNEKYFDYLTSNREPRYTVKTFFLNSYKFLKTLGREWENYLERYSNIFQRDPSKGFYKYRDPTQGSERRNSLEWTTAFEIVNEVGFPYNESAKRDFIKFSKISLKRVMMMPDIDYVDFMVSSAVAHLSEIYIDVKEWFPSQLEKYLQNDLNPHQLMIYLKALREYEGYSELRNEIISRLLNWIKNPVGTMNGQIIVWARLITRMQWLQEIKKPEIRELIEKGFSHALDNVYEANWAYNPMILEACYLVSDETKRKDIQGILGGRLTPSSFFKFHELFDFLTFEDEALEVKDDVIKIKEKCKSSVSKNECKACMNNKKGDCWIRILSKLTDTEPSLHSGYEVADKVIYELQHGIYFVLKATPITKQIGEGDVLFRQCVSLFSIDHALVIYLNPCETAPFIIEKIKKTASNSKTNPRFEVIDNKYIRQIYSEYLEKEKESQELWTA